MCLTWVLCWFYLAQISKTENVEKTVVPGVVKYPGLGPTTHLTHDKMTIVLQCF